MMNKTTPAIEAHGLVQAYGEQQVLNGLDLCLAQGTIMGLLGENGSGKTTLMHCLLGFLKPRAGSSCILGDSSRQLSDTVRQRLAFVPQVNDLSDWMTGEQIIHFTSRFYSNWNMALTRQLIAGWQIPERKVIREMSVGQAQKLAIVLAMSHEPDVLLMDEPVSSLDPAARRAFIKQLIEINGDRDSTVLFSTHITSDIERVAADVAILKDGRTFFQGGIDDLKEKVVRLHVRSSQDLSKLNGSYGVLSRRISEDEAVCVVDDFSPHLLERLRSEFAADVNVQPMSLEDIFVAIADSHQAVE
ncbi:MAG: ABC transporter ATP-binding protein [Pseudohongiellaceae bacterium]